VDRIDSLMIRARTVLLLAKAIFILSLVFQHPFQSLPLLKYTIVLVQICAKVVY
jgi:hypothetical protein